ncbi:SOS response-associated peptidase [Sulfitobacter sediminilitoris]|uniref:SOS response-associated peptidase n=1 Tax=Sulfitobacter sediminilitoris TaxID=2698830 RepID=UPI00360E9B4A
MPGRLFLDLTGAELAAALGMDRAAVEDEPRRQNIAPGQQIIVQTAEGLGQMRWGIIPVGRVNARGRPVMETLINARSETVFDKSAYEGVGRAVVPVSGWYEWTGEKRRKTAWRIRSKDKGLLFFAAITDVWEAPGGITVPQVATVTCPPNQDVAPIHHRMGVVLQKEDVPTWLHGSKKTLSL